MDARDKAFGLVAGLLVGDALGAPFQAVKAGHIQQLLGGRAEGFAREAVLFPERPEKNRLPGLHTVLGQEFLAVLAGASDDGSGRSPLARAAAQLAELAGDEEAGPSTQGAMRAPGRPLRRAVARWKAEYPWETADHFAPDEDSEGASCAVRALAAAVVPGVDAVEAARLTHLREAPLAAAWTISEAARLLLALDNPKRPDAAGIARHLVEGCRAIEDALREGEAGERWRVLQWGTPVTRFSACLEPLASLVREGDDALAERTVLHQAAAHAPTREVAHVQHGFAPALVPWVLYRALGSLSPASAIEDVLNRGGECALATGLVGALMGARYGAEHLPPEWLAGCRALGTVKARGLSPSAAAIDAWLGEERAWTAEEERLREPLRREAEKRRAAEPARKKPERNADPPTLHDQGSLPFAPPPQVWLEQREVDLAPWEKRRLKAERGRKRIDWKETRREKGRLDDEAPEAE
ncbi:MAG: ADP-ribosylglycohydrolase family protein [Candidatus Sumerlaeia bacterium]|nr:ADP-ribosylglycohydrolase family protein [Candidatus Sumerlaeia bacterium]